MAPSYSWKYNCLSQNMMNGTMVDGFGSQCGIIEKSITPIIRTLPSVFSLSPATCCNTEVSVLILYSTPQTFCRPPWVSMNAMLTLVHFFIELGTFI